MSSRQDSPSPLPAWIPLIRTSINRSNPYLSFFLDYDDSAIAKTDSETSSNSSDGHAVYQCESSGNCESKMNDSCESKMNDSRESKLSESCASSDRRRLARRSVLSIEELLERKKTKLNPYVGCFHYAPGRYSALHPLFNKAQANPDTASSGATDLYCDVNDDVVGTISNFFSQRKISQSITLDEDREMLGMGSYACVLRGHFNCTGKQIAVKYFKKLSCPSSSQRDCDMQSAFITNEVSTLRKLRHNNIVQYIDCMETAEKVYLVMELCNAGSLEDMVYLRRKMNEDECRIIFVQLCNALKYIHGRGIIHGDVKTQNIMFQVRSQVVRDEHPGHQIYRSPIGLILKLCDFGSSRQCTMYSNIDPEDLSLKGTEGYLSPEQIQNGELTTAIDMWAAGVVLYKCVTGQLPFRPSASCLSSGPLQFTGPWWSTISDDYKYRIRSLLELDSSSRASAAECLRDSWTSELDVWMNYGT